MPLEAVVTAVGVEIDAAQRPRELGRAGRFGLRTVRILRGSFTSEVRGHAADRPGRRMGSSATFHGIATLLVPIVLIVSQQVDAVVAVRTTPTLDDGDHERFTHIVLEGYTPKDGEFVALENSVVGGMINSTPVKALCGKIWVPGRDPQKYPLCGTCKEIAASMGWSLPKA
jgi:hypothetical protein